MQYVDLTHSTLQINPLAALYSGTSLKEDTFGTQLAFLYREVSPIQRQICTQFYMVASADSALIKEVFLTQSVLYREVPLCVKYFHILQIIV